MKIKRKKYHFRSMPSQNKVVTYISNLLVILLIIISLIFLALGFNVKNNIKPHYSYSIKKSSPYNVLLIPNDFYVEDVLPSGGYYASKAIDSFLINFKYNFKADKQANIEYIYNITADLIGRVNNGDGQPKEVWTRKYILQDNVVNSGINTDSFLIDKNINIDYASYNSLARSYEKTYGITIETNLKVSFNISCLVDLTNFNLSKEKIEDNIELNIPINSTVTNINENYKNEISKDIFSNTKQLNTKEIIFYVLSGLFLAVAIFIVITKIIIKARSTPEEIYNHNIKRILKYYKDLIVTVSNEPNISSLEIMNINILNDLIDVAEQNQSNIIHYEEVKNERSNLYVIVGKFVYIYVVTADTIK